MEIAVAAGDGRQLLFLAKRASFAAHDIPCTLPLKTLSFCPRRYACKTSLNSIISRFNHPNADNVWSRRFKFKNTRQRETDGLDGKPGSRRKKRRWWSDKPPPLMEEEATAASSSGILEEFIDSLWIFEVFKSYGWALPPIVISWLIATGPKAFLLTISLPLGQSVITFVIKKLWETVQGKRKYNPRKRRKRRKKPFARPATPSGVESQEQDIHEIVNGNFGSWAGDDQAGSFHKESREAPSFGGWDELYGLESIKFEPPGERTSRSERREPSGIGGRLGRRGRNEDAPLLLRLLISVFPFLASWTKML